VPVNARDVTDLATYLWYIKEHEERIFVRQQHPKGWHTVALSSLEPRDWGSQVAKWIDEGRIPYRVLTPQKMEDEDA
jgi:hypothetical protein